METIDNNKLIAEFMGTYRTYDGNYTGEFSLIEHGGISYTKNNGRDQVTDGAVVRVAYAEYELLYHKSWDWLMPVVEKIELMLNCKYSLQTDYDNREGFIGWSPSWFTMKPKDYICGGLEAHRFKTKIEAAYKAVTELIKWYNANK